MCRRNQLCGCCMIAFGLGLLIGLSLESSFICGCLGVGAVVAGFFSLHRK